MRFVKLWLLAAVLLCPAALQIHAQDKKKDPLADLNWTKGPAKGSLKNIAEVQVPEGFALADGKSTRKLLEMMGNPTSGSELGLLAPTSMVWFVVFEFSDTGYIKDDEKDKLDADAMLKSITEGNEAANKQRKKMGAAPMHITGWEQPPKYNPETHNLEWAIRGESEGSAIVNYNTRLLGRKGVMEVSLVVEPEKLADTMPAFQAILKDYSFQQGQSYAEYRAGDKVATYGLAALITGGAAVAAVKTGLLGSLLLIAKKAWKLVAVAVVAVLSFFKRIFGGNKDKPTA